MDDQATAFDAKECEEGYWICTAWNDWLWACRAADPTCRDEGRDPDQLPVHDFHPPHCHKPDSCPLYVRGRRGDDT